MPEPATLKWAFDIREDILWKRRRYMYLYPVPEGLLSQVKQVLTKGLDAKFVTVASRHLKAFMTEGVEPPAAIAGAIRNFADDVIRGEEVNVRAGDYVAMQTFIKAGGK